MENAFAGLIILFFVSSLLRLSEDIAVRHVTRLGTDIYSFCSTVQTQSGSCFSNINMSIIVVLDRMSDSFELR